MKRIFWVVPALVLSLGLAAACGPSQEQYNARLHEIQQLTEQVRTITGERDRLTGQVASLRTSSEAMANRLRELGENVERLQASSAQTQSELDAARHREEELRRAQQASEQRLATFRQMLERFRAMITSGQLRVRIVRGRMVIELPAGILFETGDARLRGAGEEVLRQVAQVLRQIPDRDFLIAGHTDNVQLGRGGRFRDNWELSSQRAVNVVRFLQENGLSPEHLGSAGYGEFQAANPNDSDEHRQSNRRVEIILMPNMNELPDLGSLEGPSPAPSASPAP
ncbi:MAG: OmpA family protein [Deltaproteobacteria bacterium]